MTSIRLHAEGPATAALAWERYADLTLWPSWSPQIRSVTADLMRLQPGVHGKVQPLLGPSVSFDVMDVDREAMAWSWLVRLPLLPITLSLQHSVEATADGSRTALSITGPLLVVMTYAPLAQLALGRLVS